MSKNYFFTQTNFISQPNNSFTLGCICRADTNQLIMYVNGVTDLFKAKGSQWIVSATSPSKVRLRDGTLCDRPTL